MNARFPWLSAALAALAVTACAAAVAAQEAGPAAPATHAGPAAPVQPAAPAEPSAEALFSRVTKGTFLFSHRASREEGTRERGHGTPYRASGAVRLAASRPTRHVWLAVLWGRQQIEMSPLLHVVLVFLDARFHLTIEVALVVPLVGCVLGGITRHCHPFRCFGQPCGAHSEGLESLSAREPADGMTSCNNSLASFA